MYKSKFKFIGFVALLFLGFQAYAQTDSTLSTTEQNEKKINELKNKLGSISEEYETKTTTNQTIVSRLVKVEKELDSLSIIVGELHQESLQRKEMDKKVEEMYQYFITQKEQQNTKAPSDQGKYYVIVEAQRTEDQINKAKSKFLAHRNEAVIILKSNEYDFYYLGISQKGTFAEVKDKVNNERANGVQKAWWVSAKSVDIVKQ